MMIKNAEVRNLYNIMKLVIIGYIMNLVVLIVPFIVYCVKMYVYKLNMRDKIWFICLWAVMKAGGLAL
jgi:hypothetical protein